MVEEEYFEIPIQSHDHIYFGNLVYGGMVIEKSNVRKRPEDGIVERKIVISPSSELIDSYKLKRERDATPQGFIVRWYPDHWILQDITADAKFGRRTLVTCDFNKEETKIMRAMKGQIELIADLLRRLQSAETKIIQQKKKELIENLNPDASFEKSVEQFKKVAEVLGYAPPIRRQELPAEI